MKIMGKSGRQMQLVMYYTLIYAKVTTNEQNCKVQTHEQGGSAVHSTEKGKRKSKERMDDVRTDFRDQN